MTSESLGDQSESRKDGNNNPDQSEDEDSGDEERLNQSEDDEEDLPEVEMNWNMSLYLPVSGSCQTNFYVSNTCR